MAACTLEDLLVTINCKENLTGHVVSVYYSPEITQAEERFLMNLRILTALSPQWPEPNESIDEFNMYPCENIDFRKSFAKQNDSKDKSKFLTQVTNKLSPHAVKPIFSYSTSCDLKSVAIFIQFSHWNCRIISFWHVKIMKEYALVRCYYSLFHNIYFVAKFAKNILHCFGNLLRTQYIFYSSATTFKNGYNLIGVMNVIRSVNYADDFSRETSFLCALEAKPYFQRNIVFLLSGGTIEYGCLRKFLTTHKCLWRLF